MNEYKIIFNKDLSVYPENSNVCVTGIINNRWYIKERFGIEITDLTGSAKVSFLNSKAFFNKETLTKGKRVRIFGDVTVDRKGNRCVGNVEKVEILEEINISSSELDIVEQESLVMMSIICNVIRNQLSSLQFIEISTRTISRKIGDEIFEPLMVKYPGFGSFVYLSPSPSTQLSQFLTVTLLPKVFTVTSSFSTSHRFPNGASEMPIIMAKAINLTADEENEIILSVVKSITSLLSNKSISVNYISDVWDETPKIKKYIDGKFLFTTYSTEMPIMGNFWNSVVYKIRHLVDDNGNLLVECMHEKINDHINICSITYYPSQFLNWVSKAPKRQIQNLWKIYDGGSIYG